MFLSKNFFQKKNSNKLLEPRQFKNNLTMFEIKLILKLPPFSLTYTMREKRRQFQNELTLKHSEVILELSWL